MMQFKTEAEKFYVITTEEAAQCLAVGMRPVHPGEILLEDHLKPLGLSVNALAKELHVPSQRLNEIVRERRGLQV